MLILHPIATLLLVAFGPDSASPETEPAASKAQAKEAQERGPEVLSTVPTPDGAPLLTACESDLVFEASPEIPFDHVGYSVAGGFNWDDPAGAPDWSTDILVGGCGLFDSNLDPPSKKLGMAALFCLPSPAEVHAMRGSRTLSSGSYLRFEGEQRGDRFGYCAIFAGDLDGADDQRSEVVVSAPRSKNLPRSRGYSEHGRVYVFTAGHFDDFGEGDTVPASEACLAIQGESNGDRLGWSMASLDFDGDGVRDLALGAPGGMQDALYSGRVYIIPGARLRRLLGNHDPTLMSVSSPELGALILEGFGASDRYGYALSSIGDQNGDGRDELAVGAPSFQFSSYDLTWFEPHPQLTPSRESTGYVSIHPGREFPRELRKPILEVNVRTLRDEQAGSHFGAALAGGVDMNGDGLGDLVVGAPFRDRPGSADAPPIPRAGRVLVCSLSDRVSILCSVEGDAPNHRFGQSVAAFRDVDGDGLGDFALGAPLGGRPVTESEDCGSQGGALSGRILLYRGPGAEGGAACLLEIGGESPFDRFGTGLASLGDVDGNGLDDLVFGAQSYPHTPGDDYGRVYVKLR